MPLHLLGKKSWNVYNHDNIEKVRHDEAQAQAREEEQERRMQEADAERRIAILRGEDPGAAPSAQVDEGENDSRSRPDRDRKRRRITGEDDTDRDIRYAREDVELAPKRDVAMRTPTSDAPLTDHAGHINLFPVESKPRKAERNAEAEAEAAKKKREYENQYTMRFSNAAGFKQGLENPWYSSTTKNDPKDEQVGKDVWGNEDPMRRERERVRADTNDPLAMMKKGVTQLRKAEQDRKKWNEEREKELAALKAAEKDQRKRRKRRESGDELDNFSLDPETEEKKRLHRRHRSDGGHHRSRSRERSLSRERHRRHSRKRKDRDSRHINHGDVSAKEQGNGPGWINAPGKRYSAQFA